ncbi:MAG: hypothetical protein HY646_04360, partial [Acidobacteria bacterium]|nr:hypothetical protein [Acidobacteriota bacterium]
LVYSELRGLARKLMAFERKDHTLQPTALVLCCLNHSHLLSRTRDYRETAAST